MAKRRRRGSGLYLIKAPKTGIYQIRGTVLGKPVRTSTFTADLDTADTVRLQTENELRQRVLHGEAAVATFAEAFNDYMDNSGREASWITRPLVHYFGNTLLSEIDQGALQKYISKHCQGQRASSVIRLVYTPMTAILRFAASNKKCAVPMFKRPKVEKRMVKHAPDEWVNDFLVNCPSKRLKGLVWLLTTTGCRISEACRIRWEHVSFDLKTMLIEKTKNGDPRSLPIEDDLLVLLRELRAEHEGPGRVFRYGHRVTANMAIRRECTRRGIPYFSSHKLGRHAIATRMLNAGYTCKETADAVGWKKVALVAETYGHLERSKVQKSMLSVSKGLGTAKKDTRAA